jgi:hypothetical protein
MKVAFLEAYKAYVYYLFLRNDKGLKSTEFNDMYKIVRDNNLKERKNKRS